MTQLHGPSVSLKIAPPRAIAAVRARLPIRRVPAMFAEYLNQVYAAARDGAIQLDGQNIFVYRDVMGAKDEADIEWRGSPCGAGVVPSARSKTCWTAVGSVRTLD